MVLRHPQTRVYQPDRASRTACRTATHPADHTPELPTQMREINVPHLTNASPYQHRVVARLRSVAKGLVGSGEADIAKALVSVMLALAHSETVGVSTNMHARDRLQVFGRPREPDRASLLRA